MAKRVTRFARAGIATSLVAIVCAASEAHAHGDDPDGRATTLEPTPPGATRYHREIDAAPTLAEEAALRRRVEAEGWGRNPATDSGRAAAALVADPRDSGRWEPLRDWPVVGIFTALLADGRVLAFDSVGDDPVESYPRREQTRTRVMLWDPVTDTITRADAETGHNLFCSGFASLPDGRLFVAGGNHNALLDGIRHTHTFNPVTDEWARTQRMRFPRWYPSVTPLANGEMLITGGGFPVSEVRRIDGLIRRLSGVDEPYWDNRVYPWLQTAPNGRVAFLGPHPQLGYVGTGGGGSWQSTTRRDDVYRSYGSYVMHDIGKALVAGGGLESASHSQASAVVIDLDTDTPRPTAPMNFRRRQHNLTVLADGSVLATGGYASNASLVDLDNAVFAAELWDPQTERWRVLAEEDRARQYHSTALLLPDGRVLSAGGGICGDCQRDGYLQKNAQVFTPPYLFAADGSGRLADRPSIETAPASIRYGRAFELVSPAASRIAKVALVRIGAVTHAQNMSQRYVPLAHESAAGTLSVEGPANADIAPPGHYLLFIVDDTGVPSVARIVHVDRGRSVRQPDPSWIDYAEGRPAAQVSDHRPDLGAERAVDGDLTGDGNSIAHTGFHDQPWWEIDLGERRYIEQIRLFNRSDCCAERLADFHVLLSEAPFESTSLAATLGQRRVRDYYHAGPAGRETRIAIRRYGRYVRVQLSGADFLQLAEVEVLGRQR